MRRAIILGRIPRRHNNPTFGQRMHAKRFVLKELKQRGHKRFRDAIDFIKKENSLFNAAFFLRMIHGANNLAHGIFAHAIPRATKIALFDKRKTQRALTRVMRNGIAHEIDIELLRNLRDNRRLSHTRRSQHNQRTLHVKRNAILTARIARKIRSNCAFDLFCCLRDVHSQTPFCLPACRTVKRRLIHDHLHRPRRHVFCAVIFIVKHKRTPIRRHALGVGSPAVREIQQTA